MELNKNRGKLTVAGGPMFAEKTKKLQAHVRKAGIDNSVVVKPSMDGRYVHDRVVNHEEALRRDKEVVGLLASLVDANNPNLISLLQPSTLLLAIDETNFFHFETLNPQIQIVLERGVSVVAVGLIYNSSEGEFGATKKLMSIADEVIELRAKCYICGKPATHTKCLVEKNGEVLVGGQESYQPACDLHFY